MCIRTCILSVALFLILIGVTPAQDSSPSLAGIAHVAFRVGDVAKSREFYQALGFEQSFAFEDPGKPLVSYIKINDRQFIELYGGASYSQPAGLMHICYEATDIEALWQEYTKRGLNPPKPKKARAGNLLFAFHDPEGQVLEFTQYLPGSLHYEDRGKHLSERRISEHLIRVYIAVHDLAVERDFYQQKLGFGEISAKKTEGLSLPGNSAEGVQLEVAAASAKPKIVFAITDLQRSARELRSRGLAVRMNGDSVSVDDPDGAVIEFAVSDHSSSSGRH